jgi:hypothetical protein
MTVPDARHALCAHIDEKEAGSISRPALFFK